jgi:hypothetical protein
MHEEQKPKYNYITLIPIVLHREQVFCNEVLIKQKHNIETLCYVFSYVQLLYF